MARAALRVLVLLAAAACAMCVSDDAGCAESAAYASAMRLVLDRTGGTDGGLTTMEVEYARDQVAQRALSAAMQYLHAYCGNFR